MDANKVNKNRRSGKERRQNKTPYTGPERRSGKDRRQLDKRLKEMIKHDEKERAAKQRIIEKSGSNTVIRRRKVENDGESTKKQGDNDGQE